MALQFSDIPWVLVPAGSGWRGRWRRLAAHTRWLTHAFRDMDARVPGDTSHPAARTGANADFERFVRAQERQILNFLWRMLGDEELAYDLTQEVFVRAWQHYDRISGYDQPRAWLFRVATNLALTQRRRRKLPVGAATSLGLGDDPSGSDPSAHFAESDLVRQTLLRLPAKPRAALVMREVYGLSCAEIGEALGMSEAAVKMALHRARTRFRELYTREDARP